MGCDFRATVATEWGVDIGPLTAIAIRLLDPGIDRLGARLKLQRQFSDAFTSPMKGNFLIRQIRLLRVPCTWQVDIFPLQSKTVHQTGGIPSRPDKRVES